MEDFLDVSEATMPDGQILKIYTVSLVTYSHPP